jgi:hypothetical protein
VGARRALVVVVPVVVAACGIDVVGLAPAPVEEDAGADSSTKPIVDDATAVDVVSLDAATDTDADADADADAAMDASLDADADTDADAGPGACVPAIANIVSWWPGEGTLDDAVSTNEGTSGVQGATTAVGFGLGKVGQGFALNGASYVQVPSAPALRNLNALTIEGWMNAVALGGRIVDKISAGGTDGYLLDTFQSKLRFIIGAVGVQSATVLPTNAWVHVAGTWDGTVASIYVNGVFVTSTLASVLPGNDLPLRIGADSLGGSRFAGALDEVAIYSRALNPLEILTLATSPTARHCQ